MEEEKISIEDFMHLFTTVGFLQEQRCFNIRNLKDYMQVAFELSDDEEESISEEINRVIDDMIKEGYLIKESGFEYLIRISETIPFMEYITKNFNYLNKMIMFLYNFINYINLVDCEHINNYKDANINLEKVYKKEMLNK